MGELTYAKRLVKQFVGDKVALSQLQRACGCLVDLGQLSCLMTGRLTYGWSVKLCVEVRAFNLEAKFGK